MVDLLDPIWEMLLLHIDAYMSHITPDSEVDGNGHTPINMVCTPSAWSKLSEKRPTLTGLTNTARYKGSTIKIYIEAPGKSWMVHAANRQDEVCYVTDDEILLINTRISSRNSYHNSTGGFIYRIPTDSILEGETITNDENLLLNENIVLI